MPSSQTPQQINDDVARMMGQLVREARGRGKSDILKLLSRPHARDFTGTRRERRRAAAKARKCISKG